MDDIVERLRNYADPSKKTDCRDTDDMCLQAADEIERLQTENQHLKAELYRLGRFISDNAPPAQPFNSKLKKCQKCGTQEGVHGGCDCGFLKAWESNREMARCSWCNLEMQTADDCPENRTVTFPDGSELLSIPYEGTGRCHDCGIKEGNYHHPGCDNEICPRCEGQLISCSCLYD